ncbi:MAG: ATPase [Actinobacteria bacterium 13_2_20CM_2_71_6]|nr:MAG: ATPase [Actinobacteria bacterium 13_2_20CM_2_71_6]
MGHQFEIRREGELPTTPEEYWDAVTTGTGGWLWPMEFEPREGGKAAMGGTVTVWDPPHHFVTRVEGEDGWFNQLEHVIEGRGGTTFYRYVHSGIMVEDWQNQYDGADKHTDFYLHTLGQYLRYFSRRPVRYVSSDGPEASRSADAFEVLRRGLGLGDAASTGDRVRLDLPGIDASDAVLDYRTDHFIGLRTTDALYPADPAGR